jgi:hypothetical protein
MNFWIFIVKDQRTHGLTADDVLSQRLRDQFWGLGERTPNRGALEKGDQVVFYAANPVKSFVASATLAGPAFELSQREQTELSHDTDFYRTQYGVRLQQINVWERRRPVEELLPSLNFIKNTEFWGTYFQGGVRQITEQDFEIILYGTVSKTRIEPALSPDIEADSEFALEMHLEEFLDRNWGNIDFGSRLEKYQAEDQTGRQFPAGTWSIDFLCVDTASGDFVVLELKRGKTSDATVGQILRYIAYVKKKLAKPGQSVRGIIIAKEIDEALRYAIEPVPDITVLTYRVDFKLSPIH